MSGGRASGRVALDAALDGTVSVHETEQVLDARVVSEVGDVVAGLDSLAHVIESR